MSEKDIVRKSADELGEGRTDWKRIDGLTDEEIEEAVREDPDQELLGEDWFARAERVPGRQREAGRERVTMEVGRDVIEFFKRREEERESQGAGGLDYRTLMSTVLEAYVTEKQEKTRGKEAP